jgi:hypothetical protein
VRFGLRASAFVWSQGAGSQSPVIITPSNVRKVGFKTLIKTPFLRTQLRIILEDDEAGALGTG